MLRDGDWGGGGSSSSSSSSRTRETALYIRARIMGCDAIGDAMPRVRSWGGERNETLLLLLLLLLLFLLLLLLLFPLFEVFVFAAAAIHKAFGGPRFQLSLQSSNPARVSFVPPPSAHLPDVQEELMRLQLEEAIASGAVSL